MGMVPRIINPLNVVFVFKNSAQIILGGISVMRWLTVPDTQSGQGVANRSLLAQRRI